MLVRPVGLSSGMASSRKPSPPSGWAGAPHLSPVLSGLTLSHSNFLSPHALHEGSSVFPEQGTDAAHMPGEQSILQGLKVSQLEGTPEPVTFSDLLFHRQHSQGSESMALVVPKTM